MIALAEACDGLASLFPALTGALTRDTQPPGTRGTLSAGGPVNPDVLHAMLTLAREIPAAVTEASGHLGEPWRPRPPLTSLRAIPRLHDRFTRLHWAGHAAGLEDDVRRWTRVTKLALGLRTPDQPIGWDCPYHPAEPSPLILLGAEGFIRADMTVAWHYDGRIWCPVCGASWLADRWLMLGRLLESA